MPSWYIRTLHLGNNFENLINQLFWLSSNLSFFWKENRKSYFNYSFINRKLFFNKWKIIIFFFSVEVFYHVKSIILVKISDKQEGILWWWRKRQKAFQIEYKSWRLLKQSPIKPQIHMNFENWISHLVKLIFLEMEIIVKTYSCPFDNMYDIVKYKTGKRIPTYLVKFLQKNMKKQVYLDKTCPIFDQFCHDWPSFLIMILS